MTLGDIISIGAIRQRYTVFVKLYIEFSSFQTNLNPLDILSEFNLPLGRGCSGFIKQKKFEIKFDSFIMEFDITSNGTILDNQMIAFDSRNKYMRRESSSDAYVKIWDIEEDLLFVISQQDGLASYHDKDSKSCSILQVTNALLSPYLRPFRQVSPNIIELFGSNEASFMGRTVYRNLPCSIYEIIHNQAPLIFGLTQEEYNDINILHYLVQFYLLDDFVHTSKNFDAPKEPIKFHPIKMSLFGRYQNRRGYKLIRVYNINDFRPKLEGSDLKSSELFMASECYTDQAEQTKLEFSIVFDNIHPIPKDKLQDSILSKYQFQLERFLTDQITLRLGFSKLHLASFSMELLVHHIDLEMTIADRTDAYKIEYWGTAEKPDVSEFKDSDSRFIATSEERCIVESALAEGASMVYYCPRAGYGFGECLVVFDVGEPSMIEYKDPSKPSCEAYLYTRRDTQSVTANIDFAHLHLKQDPLEFNVKLGSTSEDTKYLRGSIRDFDITREPKIEKLDFHTYVIDESDSTRIWSLESVTFKSRFDCERICNQDIKCLSYSFCSEASDNSKCIFSSLDIVESHADSQLAHKKLTSDAIELNGKDNSTYKLRFTETCNIFEPNPLNMFRSTDEFVLLSESHANQLKVTGSSGECAKLSANLDRQNSANHVAMFAYCSVTKNCLIDENLITRATTNKSINGLVNHDGVVCRIYRKKYQSYFTISTKVSRTAPANRIEYASNSVEECARDCWYQRGHECVSFDYCSPNLCRINAFGNQSEGVELELNHNCFHYERQQPEEPTNFLEFHRSWGPMSIVILCVSIVAGLFGGFLLGTRANQRLEALNFTQLWRWPRRESRKSSQNDHVNAREMFGFSRLHDEYDSRNELQVPQSSDSIPMARIESRYVN